jgi:hypothetical protein
MSFTRDRRAQAIVRSMALLIILTLLPLLVWDVSPKLFPERAHDVLAAVPLALIALVCPLYVLARRGPVQDLAKAGILAAAFLFWAANQLWPDDPRALLFNDIAIALFVVDGALAILGWPSSEPKVEPDTNPACG